MIHESDQEFFYLVFLHLNFYKAPFIATLSGLYSQHYWKEGLHSAKRDCFRTYNYNPLFRLPLEIPQWTEMDIPSYLPISRRESTIIRDYVEIPVKEELFLDITSSRASF